MPPACARFRRRLAQLELSDRQACSSSGWWISLVPTGSCRQAAAKRWDLNDSRPTPDLWSDSLESRQARVPGLCCAKAVTVAATISKAANRHESCWQLPHDTQPRAKTLLKRVTNPVQIMAALDSLATAMLQLTGIWSITKSLARPGPSHPQCCWNP